MCHWIGLHHMLVMFASHAWAQTCTATHLLVGLHICANYALVSGQDGVWGRFLDSGHMLEEVLEKRLLVECKIAADEKSKEWQWGLFNKVKLPKINLFIATFCTLYIRIQIHSLTKYIWSTTPCFPIHVWTLWPSPLSISEITILVNISKGTDVVWEREGATNCTCVLIFLVSVHV